MKKLVYHLGRKYCPRCRRLISAKPPGVLAKCLYSNQLLAYVAVQHYVYGNTLGQIEKQTGIGYSSLVDALHQLSRRLKDVPRALINPRGILRSNMLMRPVGELMVTMVIHGCFAHQILQVIPKPSEGG